MSDLISKYMTSSEMIKNSELNEIVEDRGHYYIEVYQAAQEYIRADNPDDLVDFVDDNYNGEWDSDEDFVEDLLESTGDIPSNFPSYIAIDWERTARNIMYDYFEEDGHYFRNS